MKNKNSIIIGLSVAIIFIFLFNGLLEYLQLRVLGIGPQLGDLTLGGLKVIYNLPTEVSPFLTTLILLFPILNSILFVEISFLILKKTSVGLHRNSTIIFQLLLTGFLIVFVFVGIIKLALSIESSSLWENIILIWKLEGSQVYVLIVFVVLVLFTYLQLIQKRIMNYISIEEKL